MFVLGVYGCMHERYCAGIISKDKHIHAGVTACLRHCAYDVVELLTTATPGTTVDAIFEAADENSDACCSLSARRRQRWRCVEGTDRTTSAKYQQGT